MTTQFLQIYCQGNFPCSVTRIKCLHNFSRYKGNFPCSVTRIKCLHNFSKYKGNFPCYVHMILSKVWCRYKDHYILYVSNLTNIIILAHNLMFYFYQAYTTVLYVQCSWCVLFTTEINKRWLLLNNCYSLIVFNKQTAWATKCKTFLVLITLPKTIKKTLMFSPLIFGNTGL